MSDAIDPTAGKTRLYVDGCGGLQHYVFVDDKELAILSDICKTCKGLCCTWFRIKVPATTAADGTVTVDWDGAIAAAKDHPEHLEGLKFAKQHFQPVPEGQCDTAWPTMTCSALDPVTHLCNAYACRPGLCRGFICNSAWSRGMPPSMEFGRMASQGKGGPFEGVTPPQVVNEGWAATIGKRLEADRLAAKEQFALTPAVAEAVPCV